MDPKYYGLVEMAFSGFVVLGFSFWQLWSVNRDIRDRKRLERSPSASTDRGSDAP